MGTKCRNVLNIFTMKQKQICQSVLMKWWPDNKILNINFFCVNLNQHHMRKSSDREKENWIFLKQGQRFDIIFHESQNQGDCVKDGKKRRRENAKSRRKKFIHAHIFMLEENQCYHRVLMPRNSSYNFISDFILIKKNEEKIALGMIISRKEIEARENTEKTIKAHITIKKLLWRNALRLDWERNSYLVQFRVSRGVSRCGEWAKHKKNKSSSSIRELQYCAIRKAERSVHTLALTPTIVQCARLLLLLWKWIVHAQVMGVYFDRYRFVYIEFPVPVLSFPSTWFTLTLVCTILFFHTLVTTKKENTIIWFFCVQFFFSLLEWLRRSS